MFDRTCLWGHLVLDVCLLEVFNHSSYFSACVVCSYFLFLSGSVFKSCTFLSVYPFLTGCPFYWHIIACSSLLWSCISIMSIVTSFSFLILLIWVFYHFFLDESGKMFISFVYLHKEPPFSYINLCYSFIHFSLIFMIAFHNIQRFSKQECWWFTIPSPVNTFC